jgi:hypothetical protein
MIDILNGDISMENMQTTPQTEPVGIENNTPSPTTPTITEKPKKSNLTPLLLILGLVVLIAAPVTYVALNQPQAPVEPTTTTALPTPIPFFLEVENPAAESVIVNGQVLVSGKTFANTTVVIYTESDEVILEADDQGMFEETVLIGDDGGLLTVTAYAEDGDEISKTFSVTQIATASHQLRGLIMASSEIMARTEDRDNQGKANQVKTANTQTVKERVENNNADKQLKVKQFLEVKTSTKVAARTEKINVRELKATMEKVRNQKDATPAANLKVKRVETQEASSGATLKRHAISGVITAVVDGMITVAHPIQRDRVFDIYHNINTLITIKGVDSASASALTVGMRLTSVGEPIDNGILAKRIHAIPGKATGVFTKNPVATESADPDPSTSPTISPTTTTTPAPVTPTATNTPTPSPTTEPEN